MVVSGNTVESLSPKHFLTTHNYVSHFQWFSNKYEQSMLLIINSISQAHLENQVTLLLECMFSAISARINSTKLSSQQPWVFFFFLLFFEPKCHSKLFMTTSLVGRVLPFAVNRGGTKVWAFIRGTYSYVWKLGTECRKRPKGIASGSIPLSLQEELWMVHLP